MIMRAVTLLFLVHIFWFVSSCEREEGTLLLHADFTTEVSVVKKESQVKFKNRSQNADSFTWDFGDGRTSTEENPSHTYLASGSYMVKLVAVNDTENDTFSSIITVKDHEITVMSYNIAFSGGTVDFLYEMWERDGHGSWNKDRISELVEIIKSIDPDILGIQEARCWDANDPKVYVSFAELIGMKYFYYPESEEAEWNGLCIYSKFPIVPKKKIFHQPCVPDQVYNGLCLLGAKVVLDSTTFLDFFSCHLMFQVEGSQKCEMETIHEFLINDLNPPTILLGDMNWRSDKYYCSLLREVGLSYIYPGIQNTGDPINIDQIWVSDDLHLGARSFDKSNIGVVIERHIEDMLPDASDHFPVVARILY